MTTTSWVESVPDINTAITKVNNIDQYVLVLITVLIVTCAGSYKCVT